MTFEELLANDPVDAPRRAKVKHPTGWEPHVEESGQKATVVTHPTPDDKTSTQLLEDSGLDPQQWKVDGTVQVRRWQQTAGGEWLRYYRFNAVRNTRDDRDLEALARKVSAHRAKRPRKRKVTQAQVVCLADWQAGKGQGGGSEALVSRVLQMIDEVAQRLRDEQPPLLVVVGMGDMVEGCDGHYSQQTFEVDLDRRQQVKLVRRLLVKALTIWAPLVPRMVVGCVPGNHGEHRLNGKSFTSFGDNDDVAVFEQVKDVLAANPDVYGHVNFVIPDDQLVITLDIAGTVVAFAHGHQFGRGTNPQAKAFAWWKGQALGFRPAGDATVLVSGHYHHFCHVHSYGRVWLQCPALDGGSKWWTQQTGQADIPGTLVFRVNDDVRDVALL